VLLGAPWELGEHAQNNIEEHDENGIEHPWEHGWKHEIYNLKN
jgi:hypothetical protein